jgi:hypothetical protein
VATHNPGKLSQIGAAAALGIVMVSAAALSLAEPAGTGSTFAANAIKARAAAVASSRPALADVPVERRCARRRAGRAVARWAGPDRDRAVPWR